MHSELCTWPACLYIFTIWEDWLVFVAVAAGSQSNVFVSSVPLCRLCVSLADLVFHFQSFTSTGPLSRHGDIFSDLSSFVSRSAEEAPPSLAVEFTSSPT